MRLSAGAAWAAAGTVACSLVAGGLVIAADGGGWPQFRGPQRDGTSAESGLAKSWPESGPPVVWKKSIGDGFSEVVVADGRVFLMLADDESELATALDAASGEEQWRAVLGPRFKEEFGDGPRATPVLSDGVLYALTSEGLLHALRAGDGGTIWTVDLVETYGSSVPLRGFAGSPLVEGDLLLVEAGGADGKAFVAFDKKSGEERWTAGERRAGYSSGIAVDIDGVRQMVFARTVTSEVVSLLPSGQVHWRYEWKSGPVATPILVPPNGLFVSSGADIGASLLKVETRDGVPTISEAWSSRSMKNHFGSSVLVGDHIYGFDNATLRCISVVTGERIWARRGFGKGTLVTADGMLYVLSDSGVLALIEATPEEYREKARFQAMTGKAWTAPALAQGRLYVRDQDELSCLDIR
jgi:outer membrane protein assembly factor BamB